MPTRCFAVLWWASSVVLYSTHPVQPFAFRSVHYAQQRRQHARHAIFALRSSRENRNSIMAGTANIGELSKAVLPFLPPESCRSDSPAESLRKGVWFKLICGASFEVLLYCCEWCHGRGEQDISGEGDEIVLDLEWRRNCTRTGN